MDDYVYISLFIIISLQEVLCIDNAIEDTIIMRFKSFIFVSVSACVCVCVCVCVIDKFVYD